MSIEEIRDMPLTDFLHKLGLKSTKKRGNEVWFHAPYRSDRTPSFCVNTEKNIWNDFGAGMGGDIFTLAGLMINSNDFMAQARYIGEMTNNPIERSEPPKYEPEPAVQQFTDVEVKPLSHPALLRYLRERGIPSDIATANCVEIHYRLHDKNYFAIGFTNESGGYEIRNKFFKGSITPKAVSLIRNGSTTVNVYEGFVDFLSGLTLGYGRTEDNLVMNSVANREKANKHLDGYENIKCWLDNDEAGRKCLEALQKRYGDRVKDFSVVFRPCKDVNEYLQEQTTNKIETEIMKKLLKKVMMCATIMALVLGFSSCEDDLDIQTNYPFEVEVMPVPTEVLRGQTVEIRCHLNKEGDYAHTLYTIRWFLYDGKGSLRMENGTILQPNDRYLLENETFRLYYTSASTDAHKFIVVVEDSGGNSQTLTFNFNNENKKDENED